MTAWTVAVRALISCSVAGLWFAGGVAVAAGIACYHYTLIRGRERDACFYAFRHNNWLGAAVFAGVALDYALR